MDPEGFPISPRMSYLMISRTLQSPTILTRQAAARWAGGRCGQVCRLLERSLHTNAHHHHTAFPPRLLPPVRLPRPARRCMHCTSSKLGMTGITGMTGMPGMTGMAGMTELAEKDPPTPCGKISNISISFILAASERVACSPARAAHWALRCFSLW